MSDQSSNQPGATLTTAVITVLLAIVLLGGYVFIQRGGGSPAVQISSNTSPTPDTSWPTAGPTFTPIPSATPIATATALPTALPRPLPDMASLNYLAVLEYPIQTVAEAQAPSDQLFNFFGTDKVSMQVIGTVIVGIDLTKIPKEDIIRNGNAITIRLPEPTVQKVVVDLGRSQILAAGRRWAFSQYPGLEKEALERGQVKLEELAKSQSGMIKVAEDIARLHVSDYLQSAGFTDVTVTNKR